MIENRFIHINEKETFEELKSQIDDSSIVFCKESGEIVTHDENYGKPLWKEIGKPKPKIDFNGYGYVNMGEAGIWATCNVGATKPEEYGLYFAFGETTGYVNATTKSGGFTWTTAPYWVSGTKGSSTKWSKYTATDGYSSDGKADNKTILELEDDVAHMTMRGDWRMPTKDEIQTLYDACNVTWVTSYNGTSVNGRLFTLKTDPTKQLFFPAAGYAEGGSMVVQSSGGLYWSSSLYTSSSYNAYYLSFLSQGIMVQHGERCYGFSVRGIISNNI